MSRQPSPPRNLLLMLLMSNLVYNFFELILDWVDAYFLRSLSFCCMAERIQAELFIKHFNLKYRLADLFKYYLKFNHFTLQRIVKKLRPSCLNLKRGEKVLLSLASFLLPYHYLTDEKLSILKQPHGFIFHCVQDLGSNNSKLILFIQPLFSQPRQLS